MVKTPKAARQTPPPELPVLVAPAVGSQQIPAHPSGLIPEDRTPLYIVVIGVLIGVPFIAAALLPLYFGDEPYYWHWSQRYGNVVEVRSLHRNQIGRERDWSLCHRRLSA